MCFASKSLYLNSTWMTLLMMDSSLCNFMASSRRSVMLLQPPCIVEEYAIGRIKPHWNRGDFFWLRITLKLQSWQTKLVFSIFSQSQGRKSANIFQKVPYTNTNENRWPEGQVLVSTRIAIGRRCTFQTIFHSLLTHTSSCSFLEVQQLYLKPPSHSICHSFSSFLLYLRTLSSCIYRQIV